jgi:hypothetical protein
MFKFCAVVSFLRSGQTSCVPRQAQHEGSLTAIGACAIPDLLILSLSNDARCRCKAYLVSHAIPVGAGAHSHE